MRSLSRAESSLRSIFAIEVSVFSTVQSQLAGRIRPFPNRVENFIGIFNSLRPSAVGAAWSGVNLVAQASRRRVDRASRPVLKLAARRRCNPQAGTPALRERRRVGRASRPVLELAARRRPHPQQGTAALLRHGVSFPLAATNMPPPAGLGRCAVCVACVWKDSWRHFHKPIGVEGRDRMAGERTRPACRFGRRA